MGADIWLQKRPIFRNLRFASIFKINEIMAKNKRIPFGRKNEKIYERNVFVYKIYTYLYAQREGPCLKQII